MKICVLCFALCLSPPTALKWLKTRYLPPARRAAYGLRAKTLARILCSSVLLLAARENGCGEHTDAQSADNTAAEGKDRGHAKSALREEKESGAQAEQ